MSKKIKLIHLYPEQMNIYGDMGNVLTLQNRCKWRDIDFEVIPFDFDSKELPDGDIYFMGGGQDNDMYKVFEDFAKNKKAIKKAVESNKVFLLICGGLQLFGNYFLDASGRKIEGLGILPLSTKAPGNKLADRCLGNLATKLSPSVSQRIAKFYPTGASEYIIGFENHGGQTYFDSNEIDFIGNVLFGKGNNSKELIEGATMNNIFASYSHGSLLPKNPHFADLLIGLALESKYEDVSLKTLDDSIEWAAHYEMLRKLNIN